MYEGFNKKKLTSLEILCVIMFYSKEWTTVSFDKAILSKENCAQLLNYILLIFGVESDKVVNAVLD